MAKIRLSWQQEVILLALLHNAGGSAKISFEDYGKALYDQEEGTSVFVDQEGDYLRIYTLNS
jgi:Putative NADH-flavin reductase